jgi:hypothetical protein
MTGPGKRGEATGRRPPAGLLPKCWSSSGAWSPPAPTATRPPPDDLSLGGQAPPVV